MCSSKQFTLSTIIEFAYVGALAYGNAAFGAGVGTSLFSSVNCNGSESSLLECGYNTNGCSHSNDAGVRCQGKDGILYLKVIKLVLNRNEHCMKILSLPCFTKHNHFDQLQQALIQSQAYIHMENAM